jgi:hypothetical protein
MTGEISTGGFGGYWLGVEEWVPGEGQAVLVATAEEKVTLGVRLNGCWEVELLARRGFRGKKGVKVTHWAWLPSSPLYLKRLSERPSRQLSVEERAALHEAGHAVAAYLMGVRFSRVRITGGAEDLGAAEGLQWKLGTDPDGVSGARLRRVVEKQVVVFAGGDAAESLKVSGHAWEEGHDYFHAVDSAGRLYAEPSELSAYLSWAWLHARNQLAEPGNWSAVKAVTQALISKKKIGYCEARDIIKEAFQNADESPLAAEAEEGRLS